METTASARFAQVLAQAAADPEYQVQQNKCAELDGAFLSALDKLPKKDRAVVRDYIRALGSSALRLTEIACEQTG